MRSERPFRKWFPLVYGFLQKIMRRDVIMNTEGISLGCRSINPKNRETFFFSCLQNLFLLGATAIEDKLQEVFVHAHITYNIRSMLKVLCVFVSVLGSS